MLIWIILIAFIITIINLIIKLLGYSFKAKKYGIKTRAEVIGYYAYYRCDKLKFYVVVKFQKNNAEEILAKSNSLMNFPIYKIGEIIPIEYYDDSYSKIECKEIYLDRFTTKREQVTINTNIRFNILDIKHMLDIVVEILIIVILLIVKMYF